jgi:hypothetical protein
VKVILEGGKGPRRIPGRIQILLWLTVATSLVLAVLLEMWWYPVTAGIVAILLLLGLLRRPEQRELTGEDRYHLHP